MSRPQLKIIQEVDSTFEILHRLHDQREPLGLSLNTDLIPLPAEEFETLD